MMALVSPPADLSAVLSPSETTLLEPPNHAPYLPKVQSDERMICEDAIAIYNHPDRLCVGMLADLDRPRLSP